MLWQENHSFHRLFRGPVETGLDMAGVPPPAQGQPDLLPATVSKQLLLGLLSLCGHGAERLDCQRASFPADPGSHQASRQELGLGPSQPRGSLPQRGSPLHTA